MGKNSIANDFNAHWFSERLYNEVTWRGIPAVKTPTDLFMLQEIIMEIQPDTIIETGVKFGGTTQFLADMQRLAGKEAHVLGIDVNLSKAHQIVRDDPGITLIENSSVESRAQRAVFHFIRKGDVVMVILDSDHHMKHVLTEMQVYCPAVTPGSYMVVEDTVINTVVRFDHGPGPTEAITAFLKEPGRNLDWEVDRTRERLLLTHNEGGYLRRCDR